MSQDDQYMITSGAPLTMKAMMKLMAERGGSDLFLSVGSQAKMKINGEMYAVAKQMVTNDDITTIMAEFLDSDQMTELETTKELNCALSERGIGRFRLSAFHQRNTSAFVLRFIPPEIPPFEMLGMPPILMDLIMLKRGLVIVAGPTGSGKSTTLASLINYRNEQKSGHIITIEDPIEFLFRHRKSVVNQREIGTDALSYEEALKNAMRQAPDVILIGEIRDQRTMSMAMQYAQSGHLCLATLHANNAYNALNRIVGFYPPEQRVALYADLSTSLKAVISQRLIPGLPAFEGETAGRVAAVEVLVKNLGIEELIAKGEIADIPERMERNTTDGSQTFESVLVEMVAERRISVDNALIYSDSPTNLFWRLSKEGINTEEDAAIAAGVDRSTIVEAGKSSAKANPGASFSAIQIEKTD